jgi:histone H3/H4
MDMPLDRVMRIRKENYAAFDSYRVALSKILTEHVGSGAQLSAREAHELYSDVLEPQLVSLEQQAKNEYGHDRRKTVMKYVAMAGAVGIGAYTGLLPTHITELCAAVGGFKLVETIAESIASVQKNPTAVRNSNLYFLLRLRQEKE